MLRLNRPLTNGQQISMHFVYHNVIHQFDSNFVFRRSGLFPLQESSVLTPTHLPVNVLQCSHTWTIVLCSISLWLRYFFKNYCAFTRTENDTETDKNELDIIVWRSLYYTETPDAIGCCSHFIGLGIVLCLCCVVFTLLDTKTDTETDKNAG